MNNAELQAYLEEHSRIIDTFRAKGLDYQNEKNQKTPTCQTLERE